MKINSLSLLAVGTATALLILALLALCTWGELAIQNAVNVHRPYTIFYLIPVVVAAALLGVRGGVLTAILSIVLARIYLFSDQKQGLALISFPNTAETIEFFALLVGTLTIAIITGRLRSALDDLDHTSNDLSLVSRKLTESERQRQLFNRDVLLAVTGGKLRLVEADEMPGEDLISRQPYFKLSLHQPGDASELRHKLAKIGQTLEMDFERIGDLETATTEAATNAIKHGNGGDATVWIGADSVTVQIEDRGTGITPAHLARATLEQGYSTRVSLGMGFHLMLQAADTLTLCTDTCGTTVLLRISTLPRPTMEDSLLARYANVK